MLYVNGEFTTVMIQTIKNKLIFNIKGASGEREETLEIGSVSVLKKHLDNQTYKKKHTFQVISQHQKPNAVQSIRLMSLCKSRPLFDTLRA